MYPKVIFSLSLIIILSSCGNNEVSDESNQVPQLQNVVVIIGDDHAAGVLGRLGNDIIKTPNLDKLSDQGLLFANAFANSPLCSASRQSLLTGKYPHATGVTLLTTSFPEEQLTLADHLKTFGYKSAIIGKNHFNNDLKHGFDIKIERRDYFKHLEQNPPRIPPDTISVRPAWKPFRDPAHIWLNSDAFPSDKYDEESIGTFYANKAVEFINNNKEGKFLLWVGFHEPHSPFNFPIEYAGKYDPSKMPLPTGSPEDDEFIPLVFKDLTEEERRGIISAYYTSVEYLDKNVGMILDGLEKAGIAEKTLIVYLGDHGYLLNDHKRFEKHMMWEEAVRAPLIIKAGGLRPEVNLRKEMVEFVDVVPTIVDLLAVSKKPDAQGRSLTPFFQDHNDNKRDIIFSEFLADNKAMVRTENWKYIYTTGKHDLAQGYATGNPPSGIRHRLYNLERDPQETTDVSDDPRNAEKLKELQMRMIKIFEETHPEANQIPDGLNFEGKLAWFCEPPDDNPNLKAK
jgi:arylsulfatase A-like enzyme